MTKTFPSHKIKSFFISQGILRLGLGCLLFWGGGFGGFAVLGEGVVLFCLFWVLESPSGVKRKGLWRWWGGGYTMRTSLMSLNCGLNDGSDGKLCVLHILPQHTQTHTHTQCWIYPWSPVSRQPWGEDLPLYLTSSRCPCRHTRHEIHLSETLCHLSLFQNSSSLSFVSDSPAC